MSKAKCFRCGASGESDTFEKAKKLVDHSIGLARGIKCGDSYGAVQEIAEIQNVKTNVTPIKKEEPKVTETIPQEKVEPKTEQTKTTSKKSKDKKY